VTLLWGRHGDMWEPDGGERRDWRDVGAGDLLVFDREVWRVTETRPVPVVDWDEHDRGYFEPFRRQGVTEEEWRFRPLTLIVVPARGGDREHLEVKPYAGLRRLAYVLHPHYPVCSDCGRPWPCPELDITREVRQQSAEMERLSQIMPGCCWSCGEPVTRRQPAIAFEGENLLLPGAPPPAFHLRARGGCHAAAMDYEERWVAAAEGRPWRLRCAGRLTGHVDGPECDQGGCPGARASHAEVTAHVLARRGRVLRWAKDCARCAAAAEQAGYRWLPDDEVEAALGWNTGRQRP
jgi:hypothetical protein